MRILALVISLVAVVTSLCIAAPIPIYPQDGLSCIQTDCFERRDSTVQSSRLLGRHFWNKPLPNHFGPGVQHKNEHKVSSTTGFHRVPDNAIFKTPTAVHRGRYINRAAASLVRHIKNALPWSKANSRGTGYPKPQTGFKNNAPHNPSPADPNKVSYHTPLHPQKNSHNPKSPGPDRLIGHRDTKDGKLHLAVAYHDPSKPIPSALPNHKQATNHPMTIARPNLSRVGAARVSRVFRGLKNIGRFGRFRV